MYPPTKFQEREENQVILDPKLRIPALKEKGKKKSLLAYTVVNTSNEISLTHFGRETLYLSQFCLKPKEILRKMKTVETKKQMRRGGGCITECVIYH